MELVADRFVVTPDGDAIDLSTHARITLLTSTVGGPTDHLRWTNRCDRLFRLSQPAIARLLDYGLIGESSRFEAWRCHGTWRGDPGVAKSASGNAALFLQASGFSTSGDSTIVRTVREWAGRPVVIPNLDHAVHSSIDDVHQEIPVEQSGLNQIDRAAVSTLAELFEQSARHPRAVALWGLPGAGVRTAVDDLSRTARINGFVPICLPVADGRFEDVLRGRSLLLICRGPSCDGWRSLINRSLESPRPHVLLFAGRTDIRGVQGVELGRVGPQTLVDAVCPRPMDPEARRRVETAARRAEGLPGRFAGLLRGFEPRSSSRPLRPHSMAAEQTVPYGEQPPRPPDRTLAKTDSWPAPGELVVLKRRMETAIDRLGHGHHATGERALRQSVGALARRRDWPSALRGALALASTLLKRGRPRDAQTALSEAREYGLGCGDERALLDVAVLAGVAATDMGRLEQAEGILRSASAAAHAGGEAERVLSTHLALARCLFWSGQHESAHQLVSSAAGVEPHSVMSIRMAILSSRVAVGRRDFAAAVALAAAAMEGSNQLGVPAVVAQAHYAAAFAHLAVGDRTAIERDVGLAVRAARAASDPLCALKARLIGAEAARRFGQHRMAAALVARINKVPIANLPATVRARVALLKDLLAPTPGSDTVARHVTATGLKALALFAPGPVAETGAVLRSVVEDISEILQCCQTAQDEDSVLGDVCARARISLNAAGTAFFANGCSVPLASVGSQVAPEFAERVLVAQQAIAPHLRDGRIEGGAPIRFGGETIGVVASRWTIGSSPDLARESVVLSMISAAAAPAVAAAIARRAQIASRPPGELLGTSGAMADVRRAIERAAIAPFAVLIEGESGSGKELVARALHRRSPRGDRPFCTLNCAALPEDLVESELFGHARGAFTGAIAERPGVFEEAHTGTLFLDEVGELSARAQAKLLRTIQEGEIRRVGENVARRIDTRIISATNRDLRQAVATGKFRLDLMYRLDVIRITVPPLRERREDVAVLAERFWREAADRLGSRATLANGTIAALTQYDWPGNVRELQNVLAALAVRSPRRGLVTPTVLPAAFQSTPSSTTWQLAAARRTFEERFVRAALVRTGGHRSRAAEELGVTRQGLTKLMTRLGIRD